MTLSVIIPHYNNVTLLVRCVKSLLAAEMGDELQIIVVDDGSEAEQRRQLETVLKQFNNPGRPSSRPTIIQQLNNSTNRGASAARNRGLFAAKGRFVWFVDADDEVDGEMLRLWWPRLKAVDEKVEMIHLGPMREVGRLRDGDAYNEVTLAEIMLPRSHCLDHTTYWISRNFLRRNPEIRYFEDMAIMEDSIFILHLLDRAKRIVAVHDCSLYIRHNEVRSVTGGVWSEEKSEKFLPCIFFFFKQLFAFMEKRGTPQHVVDLYHRYCYVYMRVLAVKGVPVAMYRDMFYNPIVRFGFIPRNPKEWLLKRTTIHAIISVACRIIRKSQS